MANVLDYVYSKINEFRNTAMQNAQKAASFAPEAFKAVTNPVGFTASRMMQQQPVQNFIQQASAPVAQFAQNIPKFVPQAFNAVTNPMRMVTDPIARNPQYLTNARQFAEQNIVPPVNNFYGNLIDKVPMNMAPQYGPLGQLATKYGLKAGVNMAIDQPVSYLRGAEYLLNPARRQEINQGDMWGKLGAAGDVAGFIPGLPVGKIANKADEAGRLAGAFANNLGEVGNVKLGAGINQKVVQQAKGLVDTLVDRTSSGKVGANAMSQPANTGSNPLQMQLPQGKLIQKAGQPNIPSGTGDILQSGYKEIGSLAQAPKKTLRQNFDEFYTNWVDRFNPIVKAAEAVENKGKAEGFMLRPENNPKYTLKKFLGMGGIAEQRFNKELKPVLDQIDQLNIPQKDIDLYLKSRRDINLGQRGIQGSDSEIGAQRVQLLEQKYGENIKGLSDQLYAYQAKGFQELADAGFFSPEVAKSIQNTNADYVPFQRVMDELDEYLGIPSKTVQQGTNPIKSIKGSDKQIYSPIESIIANTFKQRSAIEKNNVMKSLVGLQQVMPELGFVLTAKSGIDTVTVWQNGQKMHFKVGADIAEAVKGLNEENMNSFLKILEYPASILRQGATGRNPDFMLPNMVRDQFDAAANSRYGYTPFLDWARGLAHLIKKDDVYQAWMNSGGAQVMSSMSGRQSVQAMLNEKTVKKRIIPKLFGWLGKGLDALGNISEQPTRVGLFNKAYKKTGNALLGAMESREGTLDFSRMGAKMKVANSIVPFLNVGIQGFDKMVRTARANPAKFSFYMSLYGATPAVMTTLYNTINHPNEYAEIPQYVKDDNFIIVTGRQSNGAVDYISIPKGNVIRYVANPTENFISYLAGTNPQSLSEFATQFLSSGAPVMGDGSSLKEVAIKTIGQNLPQAIKPVTENLVNKSFYKYDPKKEQSKEIVPFYMNDKPAGDRAYKFTPAAYQTIGKVLNVSPLQVQNALEGYLAGYVKIPVSLIENFNNMSQGKDIDKNKIPVLRRFIQQTYPTENSNPSIVSYEQMMSGNPTSPNKERANVLNTASAAEFQGANSKTQNLKLMDQQEKALREQVKLNGNVAKSGNKVAFLDSNGETRVIDLNRQIYQPKLSGKYEVDKLELTKQASSYTQKINDIQDLYRIGLLSADSANTQISKLKIDQKNVRLKYAKPKKPKTIKIKTSKLRIPKYKKVKFKKLKAVKFKVPKIANPKAPKVKIS